MPPVSLTVLKFGKGWTLQVNDMHGTRSLGEFRKRADLEALAYSVIEDAERHGEKVVMTLGRGRLPALSQS